MPTAIGIDLGTSSARALLVDVLTGEEIATAVASYPSGDDGVSSLPNDVYLARQRPADYRTAVVRALKEVAYHSHDVIGIGLDATASTPLPVLQDCRALADLDQWRDELAAQAWLWKDHTALDEAEEISHLANAQGRPYLSKCGGAYSSEWFWSKALKCARSSPLVFQTSATWMESIDWVVAWLTGCKDHSSAARNVCAAGHKGLYSESWGGWPDDRFLEALDPILVAVKRSLPRVAQTSDQCAGVLCQEVAAATGLRAGTPVAVGLIDAHAGAVGCGVKPGTLVKIIGTSACDVLVAPNDGRVGDIVGISGIVDGSVIPGMLGIEAGQAAVGDLLDWFVNGLCPGQTHEELSAQASRLRVGESGIVALDWNNGCRSVLSDQALTGLLVGQTLATQPHEVYRALIEATAFGARKIVERLVASGVAIDEIIACGGVAEKSPQLLQIYSDVLQRPIKLPRTEQACALGAAIFGAVVGGGSAGRRKSAGSGGGGGLVLDAVGAMTGFKDKVYVPDPHDANRYDRLFSVYERLYDSFGSSSLMKELIAIRGD